MFSWRCITTARGPAGMLTGYHVENISPLAQLSEDVRWTDRRVGRQETTGRKQEFQRPYGA